MVVLVHAGHGERSRLDADLLRELTQRALQRLLAEVEGAPGDAPRPAPMAELRTPGQEQPREPVVVDVAHQHPGCPVAAPAHPTVGDGHEAIAGSGPAAVAIGNAHPASMP